MAASQQNGHDFDNELKSIFNVTNVGYTSLHDIPGQFNDGIDASVKSAVGDSCDCGDAIRMFNNSQLQKYHLIRGRFEQVGSEKHLREVHQVDLSESNVPLWGSITLADVTRLSELTKTFRPGKEDVRRAVHALKAELNARSGAMQFRPKMDSKQARLQCSIPKWTQFVSNHPSRVIYHTTTGLFRGHQLTLIRNSPPRIRRGRS